MFTYVKARNFKSLKEIEFNLNKTKNKINPLVVVYGENGSGKTNLVELFQVLKKSLIARCMVPIVETEWKVWGGEIKENFEEIQMVEESAEPYQPDWRIATELQRYRMIGEKDPTELEFGFQINGIDGFYAFKFTDEVIEESLYYKVDKQRAYLYQLKKEEGKITKKLNQNIFPNSKYREELYESIEQYWGKYTFLSLLMAEKRDKNRKYIENNIASNIFEVTKMFLSMIVQESERKIQSGQPNRKATLRNIQRGEIREDKLSEIRKYETILNIFFTQAYADIKQVKYLTRRDEGRVSYRLYFEKMIGGKLKSIPSTSESEGTQRILRQFNTLVGALTGETVIIDEIDNGIHDVLMKNIILSIQDEITGQLIVTTHNTLLLEVLPKEYLYILSTDYKGNKEIQSIKEYDIKVQKNHNARDLYLKGIFGGIPTTEYIDFEEIKDTLVDWKETNGEEA